MIKCPSCQAENSDGAKTCFLCGQRLKKPGLLKRMFGGGGAKGGTQEADLGYEVDLSLPETGPVSGQAPASEGGNGEPPYEDDSGKPETPEERLAHAKSLKDEGRVLLNEGEYRRAIDVCSKAIELAPTFCDAYYNRGVAYLNMAIYDRALEDMDAALRINPADADAYANKGMIYLMTEEPHLAQSSYEEAIRLNPQSAYGYLGRGAARFDMGQFESSIDDFNQAIRLDPNLGFAYNNRAVSYIRLGRYDEAQADVGRAQQLGIHPAEAMEELRNRR